MMKPAIATMLSTTPIWVAGQTDRMSIDRHIKLEEIGAG
jgi:hypothetical protein